MSGGPVSGGQARAGVTAAHPEAARAGRTLLERGGNAVDAAVATAFALAVVDAANCGVGGHGGCMVIADRGGTACEQVDFNTAAPIEFDFGRLRNAGRSWGFAHGGASVSVPAAALGLLAAHRKYGRRPLAEVMAPSVELAAQGIPVSAGLAAALRWAARNHHALNSEFRRIFFSGDTPLDAGAPLRQPDLAATLRRIADEGEAALRAGSLVEAIVRSVNAEGGALSTKDFGAYAPQTGPADRSTYRDAAIFGVARAWSGFEVLASALRELEHQPLERGRSPGYVEQIASALRVGWNRRAAPFRKSALAAAHTTHLCAVDAEGCLVSLTFTHGPLWFGSGLVAGGTGIVLNAGANLLVEAEARAPVALHNMCPVIVRDANGSRHAIGSPGGTRIPAIVLQAVTDLLDHGIDLAEALALPRVAVTPDGLLEADPELAGALPQARAIELHEYYGPASSLTVTPDGRVTCGLDSRFEPAFAAAG